MNRNAIASAISHRHGLSRAKALEVVDDVLDVTRAVLAEQGRVTFSGFGRFEVVSRPTGDGPQVVFRAAPALRRQLSEDEGGRAGG